MLSRTVSMSATGPQEVAHRSLWLQEILPHEGEVNMETLAGTQRCDVCIIGGGFLGLWTAIILKEREPSLKIMVLEADICGGGASGRNGGFAMTWWSKLATLANLCGEDDGRWLAEESETAVQTIGESAAAHGIDCDFQHDGWLWVASGPAQVGSWLSTVEDCRTRGVDMFTILTPEESRERGGSPRYLGGIWDPTAARVQPAALARGLRRVAIQAGISIFEDSPVIAVDGRMPLTVRTMSGAVVADTVVCAMNSWLVGLPQFHRIRRSVVTLSSDMVATAPAPHLLTETGWTGAECITDSRLLLHYHRTTRDGRIALGKAGGQIAFAGRFGKSFHHHRGLSDAAAAGLRWLYPAFSDVEISHAWSGPIDRTATGLPFFGRAPDQERLLYGLGFSGNGVGPSIVGAQILASMALDADDRWSSCALAHGPHKSFPPEPVRYVGGRLVREAVRRKEEREDNGRTVPTLLKWAAAKAPSSYVKVGGR